MGPSILTDNPGESKTKDRNNIQVASLHETHARLSAWQAPMRDILKEKEKETEIDESIQVVDEEEVQLFKEMAASGNTADANTALQKACDWMDSGIQQLQAELNKSIRDRSQQLITLSKESNKESKRQVSVVPQQTSTSAVTSEQPLPCCVRLKVHFRQTIRIVNVDENSSFQQLKLRLSNDYNLTGVDFMLKYIDAEKDMVILSSQNDLRELMSLQLATVTVHVLATQQPTSTATLTSHQAQLQPLKRQQSNTSFSDGVSISSSSSSRKRVDSTGSNISNWRLGEVLGRGAFGTVYLGFNLDNGELMAVKKLDTTDMSTADLNDTEKELTLLSSSAGTARLMHQNIVRYLGMERTADSLCIFLEYVSGGSLKDLIKKFGVLPESVLRTYTRQILLGLHYLHKHGVAHRDIKGANLLITNEGVIKLADFGASKLMKGAITGQSILTMSNNDNDNGASMESGSGLKGTPCWMAPEVIKGECKSVKDWQQADVWSIGCTIIEMSSGKPPWCEFSNPLTAMYHIAMVDSKPTLPSDMSREGLKFLSLCMQHDISKRPNCLELLSNSYITSCGLLENSFIPSTTLSTTPTSLLTSSSTSSKLLTPIATTRAIDTQATAAAFVPPLSPLLKSTLKRGIRSMSKEDLATTPQQRTMQRRTQYQHSFHADKSKPPIALRRLGHIKTKKITSLASLHSSSSPLLSPTSGVKSKTRSPFVKRMPWEQPTLLLSNGNGGKHESEILTFDSPPTLLLAPLERPAGAAGQGEGCLASIDGGRDRITNSIVRPSMNQCFHPIPHPSSKPDLESLSWS